MSDDLHAVSSTPACDCCAGKDFWRRATCLCDCHVGPPLTLALMCRTLADMQGKPHLRGADDA